MWILGVILMDFECDINKMLMKCVIARQSPDSPPGFQFMILIICIECA